MTVAEILNEARAKIAVQDTVVEHIYATDAKGFARMPNDDDACQFCAVGALLHVIDRESTWHLTPVQRQALDVLFRASFQVHEKGVTDVNDQLGRDAVLQVYDKAIGLCP